jgi:hypothetical protein
VGEQARTAETAVAHAPTSHDLADFSLAPAFCWDMAVSEAVPAWDTLALGAARPPHSFRWPSSAAQPTAPRLVLPAPEAGPTRAVEATSFGAAVVATVRKADGMPLAVLADLQPSAAPAAARATPAREAQVKDNFGKLPLSFEQNVGQTDTSVRFFTRGQGYGLFLTATEAVMMLNQGSGVRGQELSATSVQAEIPSMPCAPILHC